VNMLNVRCVRTSIGERRDYWLRVPANGFDDGAVFDAGKR
jgi:hypothetical protein